MCACCEKFFNSTYHDRVTESGLRQTTRKSVWIDTVEYLQLVFQQLSSG